MGKNIADVIVVAREGYNVLLNVDVQNFNINSYEPINLSKLFSKKQLDACASLHAHLEDGNLVYYKGQDLPKNRNDVSVKALRETKETKIEAVYTQNTETSAKSVRVATNVKDIDSKMKSDIQEQVDQNREKILSNDQKILAKREKSNVVEASSRPPQSKPMTPDKLRMEIKMDVSPEEFEQRQKDAAAHLTPDESKIDETDETD